MILAGAYPLAYVSNIHIPIIGSKVFMRFISKVAKIFGLACHELGSAARLDTKWCHV